MSRRNGLLWFKLHHSILHSKSLQNAPDGTFRVWIGVMCLASSGEVWGHFPADVRAISYWIRQDPRRVKTALMYFLEEDMIEPKGDLFHIVKWEEYQLGESTRRTREYRKRLSQAASQDTSPSPSRGTSPERIEERRGEKIRPPYPPASAPVDSGPAGRGNGKDAEEPYPKDTPEQEAEGKRKIQAAIMELANKQTPPPRTPRGEKF